MYSMISVFLNPAPHTGTEEVFRFSPALYLHSALIDCSVLLVTLLSSGVKPKIGPIITTVLSYAVTHTAIHS